MISPLLQISISFQIPPQKQLPRQLQLRLLQVAYFRLTIRMFNLLGCNLPFICIELIRFFSSRKQFQVVTPRRLEQIATQRLVLRKKHARQKGAAGMKAETIGAFIPIAIRVIFHLQPLLYVSSFTIILVNLDYVYISIICSITFRISM